MIAAPAKKHRPHPRIHRPAILREPLRTISAPESAAFPAYTLTLAGNRIAFIECAKCGKAVCASAVVNDPVELWHHQHVVRRRLFCDHCNHIQFWFQQAASDGALYSPVIEGPGYLKKPSLINAFLRQYPHAAGIEQSASRPL